MKDLSNYEMQELLPDYAFGRLDAEQESVFEYNLNKYPDISTELENVRAVFDRLEATDLDAVFSKHTRNMSVKVNDRIAARKHKSFFTSPFKFAYPALTIMVLGIGFYWMFLTNSKQSIETSHGEYAKSKIETFTEKDLGLLIDSNATEADIQNMAEEITETPIVPVSDASIYDEQVLEKVSINLLSENVINKIDKPSEVSSADVYSSYYEFLDNADEIGEENFQYILKEIQDENF